jgi:hypothetical protein
MADPAVRVKEEDKKEGQPRRATTTSSSTQTDLDLLLPLLLQAGLAPPVAGPSRPSPPMTATGQHSSPYGVGGTCPHCQCHLASQPQPQPQPWQWAPPPLQPGWVSHMMQGVVIMMMMWGESVHQILPSASTSRQGADAALWFGRAGWPGG